MRIFSGIQPSGVVHIGNFLGAMKNWVELQKEHECIFCVVDLHAITDPDFFLNKTRMQLRILNTVKDLLALGIDVKKSIIFLQSDRSEHTELAWILGTRITPGMLTRIPTYKDRVKKLLNQRKINDKNIIDFLESNNGSFAPILRWVPFGYLTYPILMAADILIYKAEGVPVGEDQMPHIELTQHLAQHFNNMFRLSFPIPKSILSDTTRILGLDGQGKMSKSNAPSTCIALSDSPDIIRQKIAGATTDNGKQTEISAGTINLINLYGEFEGKDEANKFLEQRKACTIKYSEFKPLLAEVIIKELEPFQKRRAEISDEEVKRVLKEGAEKLRPTAQKTIDEVKDKMGLKI